MADVPCIWPINSSLSSRSVPARISNFAVLHPRNFDESPVNHPIRVCPGAWDQ